MYRKMLIIFIIFADTHISTLLFASLLRGTSCRDLPPIKKSRICDHLYWTRETDAL